ncbi:MAG TPA: N,N-dimethylformamidase beta subunit family domain-containing protein [Acidimicrobiales bacterium]|nr:N,N-dimethylformamidase beta subunit family domain-containing protein [Acidimicrobiales bacterium]
MVPGADLVLRVSTTSPRFRVDFYRFGAETTLVSRSGWETGRHVPDHLPYQDWGQDDVGLDGERLAAWPAYRFPVEEGWRPGVHLAVLVEDGRVDEQPGVDARSARALFVVRNDDPTPRAHVLYKLPLLTYHAYNCVSAESTAWSLYSVPAAENLPVAVPPCVSFRRPGGGTGGTPWDIHNYDPFDPTPRQTFVHWDARFLAWLEGNGYDVDVCTDLDVHADDGLELLARYPLLVSAGHDEYWTDSMRANVASAVARGHNVAFFGGNTCWWRVTFDDDCSFRRLVEWSDPASGHEPENSLTGVSFRNGGERDRDDHPVPVGYRVQHADHWVFDGTGLADGATFGDAPDEYLVGYECDGARFDRRVLERRGTVTPTGEDGTPPGFVILGVGDVAASGWGTGNRAATMGLYTDNGTVFNGATTDWPRLLGQNPVVDRVTHNVLERLSAG